MALVLASCKTTPQTALEEPAPIVIPMYDLQLPARPVLQPVVLDYSIPQALVQNYIDLTEYILKFEASVLGNGVDDFGVIGYLEELNRIFAGQEK